jgi:hypothetical protein
MKAIGIIGTIMLFVFAAMFNHTWNIMAFSQGSVYFLAIFVMALWICLGMISYLDSPQK